MVFFSTSLSSANDHPRISFPQQRPRRWHLHRNQVIFFFFKGQIDGQIFFSSTIMTSSKLSPPSCLKEFDHSDVSSYRISECLRLLKLSPFVSQLRSPCALIQCEMAQREAKEMAPERERKKRTSRQYWSDVDTSHALYHTEHTHFVHLLIICHPLLSGTWRNCAKGFHGDAHEYWTLNKWLLDSNSLLWLNKIFGRHWESQRCHKWPHNKCEPAIQ